MLYNIKTTNIYDGIGMRKQIIIFLLTLIFCMGTGVSRASMLYTPTDDVTFSGEYAINSVNPLTSYNYSSDYYSTPYLKFDISDIKDESVQSITLRMHVQSSKGTDTPALSLYAVDSGTWHEGGYYLIQGTTDVNLSDYAAFTNVNKPEKIQNDFLVNGIQNGEWYEWQIQYNELSDIVKAAFSDGIISFAIEQQGTNYIKFDSKESRGDILEVISQDGSQSKFAIVSALPNTYAPQLSVELMANPNPEPSTLILGAFSFLGILAARKRKGRG